MKWIGTIILVALLGVPWDAAVGTTPDANQPLLALIDEIYAGRTEYPAETIQLLEAIVEGRAASFEATLGQRFGASASGLSSSFLRDPDVRVYAVGRIGLLGSDEAIQYLTGLAHGEISGDVDNRIYGAAQIEYRRALLRREPSLSKQMALLEPLIKQRSDPWVTPQITRWAIGELCDRGSTASMSLIATVITASDPTGARGEIRFCEARMQVVNSNPNPVEALGAALMRLTGDPEDTRIVLWAMTQLLQMHTPEADAALDRFVAAVLQLPADSPAMNGLRANALVLQKRPR